MTDRAETATPAVRMPHNPDEERAVLGAILLDNDVIDDVARDLRPEDFHIPAHQAIYAAMMQMHDRGAGVELISLCDELRQQGKLEEAGGAVGIASLEQFVVSTGHAPELAKRIAAKSTLRRLIRAADQISRESAEERRSAEDMVAVAEKLIFDISQMSQGGEFRLVGDLMEATLTDLAARRGGGGKTGVPSGFIELDRILNGFHKNELIILGARPSIGKTAFALNIMLNVTLDANVPSAIFSLEMGAEQLVQRLLTSHARVNADAALKGYLKNAEFERMQLGAGELASAPIWIDDTPGLSLMQLRSRARRLKATQPDLGLIIVDYLQLMHVDDKKSNRSRQEEVAEISRGLKALARELKLPVIALSQLSRGFEQRNAKSKDSRPVLSDLRESGAIEQDADVVIFLHRERTITAEGVDEREARDMPIPTEVIVAKNRNGPIDTAKVMFFRQFTRFMNSEGP
jgi:replicative DNA helicase